MAHYKRPPANVSGINRPETQTPGPKLRKPYGRTGMSTSACLCRRSNHKRGWIRNQLTCFLIFFSRFRIYFVIFWRFSLLYHIVTYDAKIVCLCVHILHFLYRLHVNQTTFDFQTDNDLRCRILCRRRMNTAWTLLCFYYVFLFSGTIFWIYLLFPDDVPHQMTFRDRWHLEATCVSYVFMFV